jgi:asparagine synthase (glutamine-hydrolysing)
LNGEIYNYRELRKYLGLGSDRQGEDGGDTEVAIEWFERFGEEGLHELRGMFALVLYRQDLDEIVLIRDRFGEKPLFWFVSEGNSGLAFASELSALQKHPCSPQSIDNESLTRFLSFGVVPAPFTLIQGIRKVRPGGLVRFSEGSVEERCWWRYVFPITRRNPVSESCAQELIRSQIEDAVRMQIESSHCELGVLLSGGLDSSIIAALAQRVSPGPLKTFSIGFDDKAFDESSYASIVAEAIGSEHHCRKLSVGDLAHIALERVPTIDEPMADPSLLPSIALAENAALYVKGVLSGDGADEIFLGYRNFEAVKLLAPLDRILPTAIKRIAAHYASSQPASMGNMGFGAVVALLARGLKAAPEHRFYASIAPFDPAQIISLTSNLVPEAFDWTSLYRDLDDSVLRSQADSAVVRAQVGMIHHFLSDLILTKTDRASMMSGLEIRAPYLDIVLCRSAAMLPQRMKMPGLRTKYLLRRIGAQLLPRGIVQRTKRGFRPPLSRLFCSREGGAMCECILDSQLMNSGLFDRHFVHRLVDDHLEGNANHSRALWTLYCLTSWFDNRQQESACVPGSDNSVPQSVYVKANSRPTRSLTTVC